jgi:arsenate reductase
MAEGIVRNLYGDRFDVYRAGTEPSRVNPYAVRVMDEIGIDISHYTSKNLDMYAEMHFDYVVTVCDRANEACPVFTDGGKKLHRGFLDPAGFSGKDEEIITGFRTVRDEIKCWIESEFCGNQPHSSNYSS